MREDLREQALRVLPDDINFGDLEDPDNAYDDGAEQADNPMYNLKSASLNNPVNKGRNVTKNPYPVAGGGERLNTIEEEEKQFDTTSNIYKTNERPGQTSSSGLANYKSNTLSKGGVGSVDGKTSFKQSPDSRKRLDEDSSDKIDDSVQEEIEDVYSGTQHDMIPTEISK